jgi:hypothetical protein
MLESSVINNFLMFFDLNLVVQCDFTKFRIIKMLIKCGMTHFMVLDALVQMIYYRCCE